MCHKLYISQLFKLAIKFLYVKIRNVWGYIVFPRVLRVPRTIYAIGLCPKRWDVNTERGWQGKCQPGRPLRCEVGWEVHGGRGWQGKGPARLPFCCEVGLCPMSFLSCLCFAVRMSCLAFREDVKQTDLSQNTAVSRELRREQAWRWSPPVDAAREFALQPIL